jgi:oligoendopeptidase F
MWIDTQILEQEQREAKESGSVKQLHRSEVPVEQTWDMTTVFPSVEAWEEAFAELLPKRELLTEYRGRLTESAEALYEAIRTRQEFMIELMKIGAYAFHRADEDTSDTTFLAMKGRLGAVIASAMGDDAWFEPEVIEIPPETLEHFIEEKPELAEYRHAFEMILREKKYKLSQAEEVLLAKASQILGAPDEIFGILSNADMTFDPIVNEKGETVPMSHSHLGVYLESRDPRVRRDAFKSMYKTFGQFRNTCATTLQNAIRVDTFNKNVRGFTTGREASLFRNAVPESVYDSLLEAVNERLPLLHRYVRMRKRVLGVEELHSYDMYVSLVKEIDLHFTFDEAKEILYKAPKLLNTLDENRCRRHTDTGTQRTCGYHADAIVDRFTAIKFFKTVFHARSPIVYNALRVAKLRLPLFLLVSFLFPVFFFFLLQFLQDGDHTYNRRHDNYKSNN